MLAAQMMERDNDHVHRAAANDVECRTCAARGSGATDFSPTSTSHLTLVEKFDKHPATVGSCPMSDTVISAPD